MKDFQGSLLIWVNIGQRHEWDKKCNFNNKPSYRLKCNSVVMKAHNTKSQPCMPRLQIMRLDNDCIAVHLCRGHSTLINAHLCTSLRLSVKKNRHSGNPDTL